MSSFWISQVPGGYYYETFRNTKGFFKRIQSNWHKITFENFNKKINSSDYILDFACGSGTFLGSYVKNNYSIGVDLSKVQIEFANAKFSGEANFISLEEFNFDSYINYFDTITCMGLLEFISEESTIELMKNFKKILKPNGKVYLSTPNFNKLMKIILIVLNRIGTLDYSNEYINKYNQKSIKSILIKINPKTFKVYKFMTVGVFFSGINSLLGKNFNNLLEMLTFRKFGFLYLIELDL